MKGEDLFMISSIYYLITLSHPDGQKGKLIMFERDGSFETHWTSISDELEETVIHYTGTEKENAWQAAEALQYEKSKDGYAPDSTLLTLTLSAIPTSYQFIRKLECFSPKKYEHGIVSRTEKMEKAHSSEGTDSALFHCHGQAALHSGDLHPSSGGRTLADTRNWDE